jgi:hypothetical protein
MKRFYNPMMTLSILSVALLAACKSPPTAVAAGAPAQPSVPQAIQADSSERVAFVWGAVGTQNYNCKSDGKGGWEWGFVAPEADLFNAKKDKVGSHGAGPFWAAPDGSRIEGSVKARQAASSAQDIPWLLLNTKSTGGPGKMAAISSVQRINTVGGVAPKDGCASAADVGKAVKQPYSSDYVFLTRG